MASSEVERFAPLFDDVYQFVYPNISIAFPAVANAGEMRTIIATILARVGIMTGATDISVSLIDGLAEALRHRFMGEWEASPLAFPDGPQRQEAGVVAAQPPAGGGCG